MKRKPWAFFFSVLLLATYTSVATVDARVGNQRSFGNRGSRGLGTSRNIQPYARPNPYQPHQNPYQQQNPYRPQPQPYSAPQSQGPSLWKSFGAGVAGGMVGGMISRALFGGHSMGPMGYGGFGGSGIGFIEILLLGGLLYLVYRMLSARSHAHATTHSSQSQTFNSGSSAEDLMRRVRSGGGGFDSPNYSTEPAYQATSAAEVISSDEAMDLFFQIQAAWGQRDLAPVLQLLDYDVRDYLEQQIRQLRAERRINRLENIAVRKVESLEEWTEGSRSYSTVRITANVLDYTLDEVSHQIVEGNRTTPVRFEEDWTFVKEPASRWKLSAIEQI